MAPEWIWIGAAIAGYVLVMACNPLRSCFVDAYDVLRGGGHLRLWLPVALAFMVLSSFEWGGAPRQAAPLAEAVASDVAAMFTAPAGLRVPGGIDGLPVKTKVALSLAAIFWVVVVVGLQFFVLTAIYLRILMPEREPGFRGLFDFAWRRAARFWPGLAFAAALAAGGLWAPASSQSALVLWAAGAVIASVFAFVQVSLLSGERTVGGAVRWNFSCWAKLAYGTVWFVIVLVIHLFLLRVADGSARAIVGGWRLVGWDVLFAGARAGVMLWLSAAWVLFFCAKTKNPTKRRIRP